MSIETDKQAIDRVQKLVDEIRNITEAQPSVECVNWQNITEDLLYFQSSLNLEMARLNEHSQD